eukprot:TRINITY_DN5000_c0_g1_i2.p1 TRINITY_DN5000_c0_g1~~TRINITY_DN5000_c0_g1_i2.p1  ORF type:complete len:154 (+),score=32.82 TRINITY_DN5000_c0_g1_i2:119-580(+)
MRIRRKNLTIINTFHKFRALKHLTLNCENPSGTILFFTHVALLELETLHLVGGAVSRGSLILDFLARTSVLVVLDLSKVKFRIQVLKELTEMKEQEKRKEMLSLIFDWRNLSNSNSSSISSKSTQKDLISWKQKLATLNVNIVIDQLPPEIQI